MTAPERTRHRVCAVDDLLPGRCVVVALPRVRDYIPREALVVRTDAGEIVAYRNECKHLPIPIDAMTRRFFTQDGKRLLCALHGAEYRVEDGFCVRGPCSGKSLERVDVVVDADEIFVFDVLPTTTLL